MLDTRQQLRLPPLLLYARLHIASRRNQATSPVMQQTATNGARRQLGSPQLGQLRCCVPDAASLLQDFSKHWSDHKHTNARKPYVFPLTWILAAAAASETALVPAPTGQAAANPSPHPPLPAPGAS